MEWTGEGVFLTGWAEILFDATWRRSVWTDAREAADREAASAERRADANGRCPGVLPPARSGGDAVPAPRRLSAAARPCWRGAGVSAAAAAASASRCGAARRSRRDRPLATAARAAARAGSAAATACCADRRTVAGTRLASGVVRRGSGLARSPTPPRRWPDRRPPAPAPGPRRRRGPPPARGRCFRARGSTPRGSRARRRPGARVPADRSRRRNPRPRTPAAPAARAASMRALGLRQFLVRGPAQAIGSAATHSTPARRASRDDGIAREYTGAHVTTACRSRR